jgi:hypothetical protein
MEVKMIKEFQAFFELFKQGKELANAASWKNKQVIGNTLIGFLGAAALLAKGFGYDLHLDEQTIQQVGMGIAAIYGVANSILTVITSAKVGVK